MWLMSAPLGLTRAWQILLDSKLDIARTLAAAPIF
jgi:hypothetical protein